MNSKSFLELMDEANSLSQRLMFTPPFSEESKGIMQKLEELNGMMESIISNMD